MKKIALALIAALSACVCFAVAACGVGVELVANDAQDILQEDFGIAVKKGDGEMLNAVNAVVDEWLENGNMDKYFDYYNELAEEGANPTAPEGLKLEWDLSGYTEELHLYTETGFAPYEFISSKGYPLSATANVAGIDVAIACQVAENLNCKLVVHDVLFDTVIQSLNSQSGKAMAAAGITITEERAEAADFSNVYSSSTLTIVCTADAQYSKLADLDGLKIGVQEGTSGDLIASAAITGDGYSYEDEDGNTVGPIKLGATTEVVQMKSYSALIQALKSGKIDVIFMDKVPALLLIKNA